MDRFEFEIDNELKSTESSGLNLESQAQQEAILFSVKVTGVLQNKRKNHNCLQEEKVSLCQLKEVYRKAARQFDENLNPTHNRGCWAMARVNMFTRIMSSGNVKSAEALASAVEVSKEWTPCSEDFFKAQSDIEKHDLNFDFKNIDDLYLEDYQPINFEWI